jgi:hypothetical protein
MPRKVFVAGEILTAADLQANAVDQSVMVFDDAAARTAAIPSPIEGMVTYLSDVNALEVYTGAAFVPAASGATLGAGSILQVVSTTKTNTFVSSSGTEVDVTDLTITITPRNASSKFLVLGKIPLSQTAINGAFIYLKRDGTDIAVGDTDGSRTSAYDMSTGGVAYSVNTVSINSLDSPATASAVTYKIMGKAQASGSFTVNRTGADANNSSYGRLVSTLTVMEVAG